MTTTWYNFNKMTSNTSPFPFVASASSEYNHEFEAWRSFNGARHPYQQWVTNKNDTEGWNQIYVKDPVLVNVIKMCSGTDGTHASGAGIMPQWLEILGSNDGVSFESLGVFTTPLWIKNQEREFVFNNKKLFSYFRISVKNAGATGWGVGFDEVYFGFNPDYLKPENKTLILSNDEYKKFNYKTDEILTYEKIVMNLTSNSSNGYEVSGTTALTSAPLFHVFDGNNGTHFRSNSGTTADIILKLPTKKRIGKFILTPYASSYPVKYGLYASNDGVIWTTLKEGNFNSTGTYEREQILDNKNEYIYYKFSALSNSGGSYVYIYEIEYFKTIVEENAIPAHWSTVSTALPTSTQFLEQGMDNLSPLLDRKVTTFEPMPMINKSEILGVSEKGKVFSKTIDLKKYFDLKQIKVQVK